jgi:hypothetical protein
LRPIEFDDEVDVAATRSERSATDYEQVFDFGPTVG